MCDLIENIIDSLKTFDLKFSKNEDTRCVIATTNGSADFDKVIAAVENEVRKIRGEYMVLRGTGTITDIGIKEAEIKRGFYVECYCYDCLASYFIRVWHEKALFIEKEWLSVDIDVIKNSLWFSED